MVVKGINIILVLVTCITSHPIGTQGHREMEMTVYKALTSSVIVLRGILCTVCMQGHTIARPPEIKVGLPP